MTQVTKKAFVKTEELNSGAKILLCYKADGSYLLKRGRFCFYDTKWKTVL